MCNISWQEITNLAHFLWLNKFKCNDTEWFATPDKIRFGENPKNYYEKDLDKD